MCAFALSRGKNFLNRLKACAPSASVTPSLGERIRRPSPGPLRPRMALRAGLGDGGRLSSPIVYKRCQAFFFPHRSLGLCLCLRWSASRVMTPLQLRPLKDEQILLCPPSLLPFPILTLLPSSPLTPTSTLTYRRKARTGGEQTGLCPQHMTTVRKTNSQVPPQT